MCFIGRIENEKYASLILLSISITVLTHYISQLVGSEVIHKKRKIK